MKAIRLLEYGGELVFNDVATPAIAPDEILVKVKSTAVNHLDLVEASGKARQILPIDLPWIPGHEFSGVIEQIGSDVAAYAPGDAVFGTTTGMGAYAEYLAVKASAIAKKPSNLSFDEAASVPVASQTAWEGIFTHGHLEKGQTILIHAGAGAVGAYAVQLASQAGATVIATASGDNEAYLNSIGASRVIDYRKAQFEKVLKEKVDVVFDLIGGDIQKRSFLVLKEGGHLVSAVQPVSQEETARYRVSGAMMRLAPSGDTLGRIARLLEEGTIRPDVATVYALQDAAQAWKDIARNLPGVHGTSPSRPEGKNARQDAGHTARSCFVWLCLSTKSGVAHTSFISLAGHNLAVNWKTGFRPNASSRLSKSAKRKEQEYMMTISVIVGSTRQGRFSEKPAQWILQQLRKREGIECRLLDLRDFPMPFFDQPMPPAMPGRPPYEHEVVKKWTAQIAASDGFVFVTPEYNYGTSAVLKNGIDWVYLEWNRKAAAFVGFGSAMGARAIQQLRETMAEVQIAPVHSSVHIPVATLWAHFQGGDVDKGLAELDKQANVMIDDLTWWTAALKAARER